MNTGIAHLHLLCIQMLNSFSGKQLQESIPPKVLSEVFEHFGDDLQRDELTTELSMIKNAMNGATYSIDNMKESIRKYQELFPQTSRLLQLLLVMPATSATSERSFSSLRHIKTYLRTTMRQDRLNHLMMLYIHKNRNVSITDAMKEFVLSNDERKCIFGNIYSCAKYSAVSP